jgi:hypothetical protein
MIAAARKADKEKEIVLAQLFASDPKLKLSIGSAEGMKTYTRDQIIKHVENLDTVGKEYVKTQMDFMRSLKSGELYALLASVESQGE